MDTIDLLLLVCAGVAAGFINVLAGGGSMLTIPAMLFLGIPGPLANGTNRIAILAQSLAASLTFHRRGVRDLRLSLSLALALLPGAVIGAYLGTRIEGVWFNRLLAVVMLAVMATMGLEKHLKRAPRPTSAPARDDGPLARPLLTHALVVLLGFYGGVIHIGIGFLIMFVLHRVGGLDLVRVNMHKMIIVIPYTGAALLIFWAESGILWLAGAALALGNAAGGWLGAHVSMTRGEHFIRLVFNVCIVLLAAKLLCDP